MAVISVSRRTDIPAFYTEWFLNRVKEGYVIVPSPFNANRASAVPLDKEYVDCFVFWTKNAGPLLERIGELDGYAYYFQYTVNRYGTDLESQVPASAEDTLIALSKRIGAKKVIWRYDPILISDTYSVDWHIRNFRELAQKFSGHTGKCVISFLDYRGAGRNADAFGIRAPDEREIRRISKEFSSILHGTGIELCSCCEKIDLSEYGIAHNSCIDGELIEELTGKTHKYTLDMQREDCGCVKCTDIGMYNTCKHYCRYCYATSNPAAAKQFICDARCDRLNPKYTEVNSIYFEGREIIDFGLWVKNRTDEKAYKEKAEKAKNKQQTGPNVTLDDFAD